MGKRKCKLLTISLTPEVKKQFDDYCEREIKNKSRLVERMIEEYIAQYDSEKEAGLRK
jgi:metal-responsive CopG/Arc/MetJ family transcriptional regulator